MARDALEVQQNPFGAAAQATEQTKRFSSNAHIAEAKDAIVKLKNDGYVLLENRIERDKVEKIAAELARLHTGEHVGDADFAGFKSRRLYNQVARTRVLDDLFLHRGGKQFTA